MTTPVKPTITLVGKQDGSTYSVIWPTVTNANTCNPISLPEYSDKSVVVSGTFDSGSVAINGSNDGTNYVALHDSAGTVIALTAAGAKVVLENTQSITVAMLFHLSNPMRQ
jgi:hypothetical protein